MVNIFVIPVAVILPALTISNDWPFKLVTEGVLTLLVLFNIAYFNDPLLLPVEKALDRLVTFKYNEPYPSIVHVLFIPILA